MASNFEPFKPDALIERRIRDAREARVPYASELSPGRSRGGAKRRRIGGRGLSVAAAAGLALIALGSFRAAPPHPTAAPLAGLSISDLAKNAGELPAAEASDAH
jgi:hypothetical protein